MSQRVRVVAKRRREIDVDKLVFALLQMLEEQQPAQPMSTKRSAQENPVAPKAEEPAA